MDTVTDEDKKKEVGVMGNVSSTLDVTKEPLSVNSTQGQFHKVLVEPDYSILDPPLTKDLTVACSSLLESHTDDSLKDGDGQKADHNFEIKDNQNGVSEENPGDGNVVEVDRNYTDDEIIETSRRIVEQSIAEALKTVQSEADNEPSLVSNSESPLNAHIEAIQNEAKSELDVESNAKSAQVDLVHPVEKDNSDEIVLTDVQEENNKEEATTKNLDNVEKVSSKKEKKSKKLKAKEQYLREREVIDSVKQFMKEEEKKSKDKKEIKKGLSFPSMFKFSKRKQKSEADETIDARKLECDISKDIVVGDGSMNENEMKDNIDKQNGVPDNQQATGRQPGIKRLNSLDSGIDVDKLSDNVNGVEYAVVNKVKTNITASNGNKSTLAANNVDDKSFKKDVDPVYMNGEKTEKEDVVYVNERAIGVSDKELESQDVKVDGEKSSVDPKEMNKESAEAKDTVPKVKKVDQIRRTEKFKLKKKSWSFNIGGSKKGENATDEIVSMDPSVSNKESNKEQTGIKKSKWRLGKFSFRRTEDLSASTPDLNNDSSMTKSKSSLDSEVSESPEHVEKKKGTKLKKIKAKKEKKLKNKDVSELDDVAVRSASLSNINLGEEKPRSRRSIVEDEIDLTQTDAFEGVAVSDLSQDEDDTEVSMNPAGSNTETITKEKEVTQDDVKDVASVPANDTDNNGGVYVNVTKGVTGSLEAEPKVVEKSQQKYIYAGDDEYAQIIKTENKDMNVEKDSHNSITQDMVVETADQKSFTVEEAVSKDASNEATLEVVEEQITMEQVNRSECKAMADSFDKLVSNNKDDVKESEIKEEPVDVIETGVTNINVDENITGYSNLIYSDESFNSELEQVKLLKDETEEKQHEDIESDAYVQLEDIVKDYNGVSIKDKPSNLILTSLDNKVTDLAIDGCESDKIKENVDTDVPVSPTVISRASITLTVQPKVIIMKEAGVQAPDIHMPLDRELDFGFIKGKPNVISVGVQVSDGISDPDQSTQGQQISTGVPTAYF